MIFAISGYLHQGQRTGLRRFGASVHCPISAINAFPCTIGRVHFARGPATDLGTSPSHCRRTVTRVQHIRDWLTISLKKGAARTRAWNFDDASALCSFSLAVARYRNYLPSFRGEFDELHTDVIKIRFSDSLYVTVYNKEGLLTSENLKYLSHCVWKKKNVQRDWDYIMCTHKKNDTMKAVIQIILRKYRRF